MHGSWRPRLCLAFCNNMPSHTPSRRLGWKQLFLRRCALVRYNNVGVLDRGYDGTESLTHNTESQSFYGLRRQIFPNMLHKFMRAAEVEDQSLRTYASHPVIPGAGLAQHKQLHATPDLNKMCLRKPHRARGTPIVPRARCYEHWLLYASVLAKTRLYPLPRAASFAQIKMPSFR
jgi:hypothetical protein